MIKEIIIIITLDKCCQMFQTVASCYRLFDIFLLCTFYPLSCHTLFEGVYYSPFFVLSHCFSYCKFVLKKTTLVYFVVALSEIESN